MKCSSCGGHMVAAIREKGNILWECCECDNYWMEHVYDEDDELKRQSEIMEQMGLNYGYPVTYEDLKKALDKVGAE